MHGFTYSVISNQTQKFLVFPSPLFSSCSTSFRVLKRLVWVTILFLNLDKH